MIYFIITAFKTPIKNKKMFKHLLLISFLLVSSLIFAQKTDNQRLIILADMGNEPDEEQQMAHMLMCSNEFDLEGLIAVTGKYLRPESKSAFKQITHPELFTELIVAYSRVYNNLFLHADGWHSPEYLKSIVASGNSGYGIEDVGDGKTNEGSELIRKAIIKEDPRPVYIVVNAGSNTLAQALWDIRKTNNEDEMHKIISKLRVFENGAQDNAGAWICSQYPEIYWIRSNYQTYCYGGPAFDGAKDSKGNNKNLGPHYWQPYEYSAVGQHQWLLKNVIADHGALGKCYPLRQFGQGRLEYMEGGGTIPWLGLVQKGVYSINHPHWGGWSGRFTQNKKENNWSRHKNVRDHEKQNAPFFTYIEDSDRWTDPATGDVYDNIFTPVFRWREAYYNDFKCRMDWCIESFENANHHPLAVLNGDTTNAILFFQTKPGNTLTLDAGESKDPDGDKILFRWWIYPEAGTYDETINIEKNNESKIEFKVPDNAQGNEIHLILEVKDDHSIARLFDYRRIVINVK